MKGSRLVHVSKLKRRTRTARGQICHISEARAFYFSANSVSPHPGRGRGSALIGAPSEPNPVSLTIYICSRDLCDILPLLLELYPSMSVVTKRHYWPTFYMPIFWPCRLRLRRTAHGMLMRPPCGRASAALRPLLGRRLGRRRQRVLTARRLGGWHLGALRPLTPRQPRDGGHPLRASRMPAAPPQGDPIPLVATSAGWSRL